MRQAGRYLPEYREIRRSVSSFIDLCMNPAKAAEVTLQPVRRFELDGAILFSDILVVPHALGQPVDFETGSGPRLSPVRKLSDLSNLKRDRTAENLSPVYETVERISSALPSETTLIGFAGAPWTVATYMVEGGSSRDFVHCKRWALSAPDEFMILVDLLIDVTAEHLCSQIEAGAEVVQIFDTWAGALGMAEFRRFSAEPVREIARRVKSFHPSVPVIAFLRGVPLALRELALSPEIDVVGIDHATDAVWAAAEIQPTAVIQGNLDPVTLLVGGHQLIEKTKETIVDLAQGAHVFNLGHGVLPETPPEHVAALVEAVRSHKP